MEQYEVVLTKEPNQVSLVCSGELDLTAADTLRRRTEEAFALHPDRIVLDLSDVTFVDSSGLNAIVAMHALSTNTGTPVVLRPGPASVMRVFSLVGLEGVFLVE